VQYRLTSLQLCQASGSGLSGMQAGFMASQHCTVQCMLDMPGSLRVLPNRKRGGLGPTKLVGSMCLRKTALHVASLCVTRLVLCLGFDICKSNCEQVHIIGKAQTKSA